MPKVRNKTKRKINENSLSNDKGSEVMKTLNENNKMCGRQFFDVDCKTLAKDMLGKVLVRQLHGQLLKGRIVETECYLGGEDKASHSYQNRKTPGNEPMYMEAGTTYVYMTYGMYYCMNISSKEPGAAVLIRALDPQMGSEEMRMLRMANRKSKTQKPLKQEELCNGPSKLCMSMAIDKKTCNKVDICNNDKLWIEEDENFKPDFQIVYTSRIGIQSAGEEWASKPLRLYILNNPHVSIRDKKAETSVQ